MRISEQDVSESIRRLKERIERKYFVKAVGRRTADDVLKLIEFSESVLSGKHVVVPRSYIEELVRSYYVVEQNVKSIVREVVRLLSVDYEHVAKYLLPALPEELRRIITRRPLNVKDRDALLSALMEIDREIEQMFSKLHNVIKAIYDLLR